MSTKINAISVSGGLTLTNVQVPTQATTDNSTILANGAFVKNLISFYNVVINLVGYVQSVSGIKTFTNATGLFFNTTATSALLGNTITIGGNAGTSTVNILSSAATGSQLYINGALQPLKPAGTVGYSVPVVTNRSTTTKVAFGVIAVAATGGTTFNFPIPFTSGCVPIIVGSVNNANLALAGFYQPTATATHIGAGVTTTAGVARNVMYMAVGY